MKPVAQLPDDMVAKILESGGMSPEQARAEATKIDTGETAEAAPKDDLAAALNKRGLHQAEAKAESKEKVAEPKAETQVQLPDEPVKLSLMLSEKLTAMEDITIASLFGGGTRSVYSYSSTNVDGKHQVKEVNKETNAEAIAEAQPILDKLIAKISDELLKKHPAAEIIKAVRAGTEIPGLVDERKEIAEMFGAQKEMIAAIDALDKKDPHKAETAMDNLVKSTYKEVARNQALKMVLSDLVDQPEVAQKVKQATIPQASLVAESLGEAFKMPSLFGGKSLFSGLGGNLDKISHHLNGLMQAMVGA